MVSGELIVGIFGAAFTALIGLVRWLIIRGQKPLTDQLAATEARLKVLSDNQEVRALELVNALGKIDELEAARLRLTGMVDLLKLDNAETRKTITGLETRTEAQEVVIEQLKNDRAAKDAEIDRLKRQNHDLFEQNKHLATTNTAHERALKLIGREFAQREVITEQKPEPKPPTGAAGVDLSNIDKAQET